MTGNFSALGTTIYNPYSTVLQNGDPRSCPVRKQSDSFGSSRSGRGSPFLPVAPAHFAGSDEQLHLESGSHPAYRSVRRASGPELGRFGPSVLPLWLRQQQSGDTRHHTVPANSAIPIGPYLSTGTNGTTTPLVTQSATLGYTKTFNPNTVLQAHFAVIRWKADITPADAAFNTATALGIPGININDRSGGIPGLHLSPVSLSSEITPRFRKTATAPRFSSIRLSPESRAPIPSNSARCSCGIASMASLLSPPAARLISTDSSLARSVAPARNRPWPILRWELWIPPAAIYSMELSACVCGSLPRTCRIPGARQIA